MVLPPEFLRGPCWKTKVQGSLSHVSTVVVGMFSVHMPAGAIAAANTGAAMTKSTPKRPANFMTVNVRR